MEAPEIHKLQSFFYAYTWRCADDLQLRLHNPVTEEQTTHQGGYLCRRSRGTQVAHQLHIRETYEGDGDGNGEVPSNQITQALGVQKNAAATSSIQTSIKRAGCVHEG